MTAEDKVYSILSASAVTALVPAGRIKPPGDWQELELPYIIHYPMAGRTIHTHDKLVDLRIWDFYAVEVYGASHSQARKIADVVVTAMDGYRDADVDRIALDSPPKSSRFDTDRKVAPVYLDFSIAGKLS